MPARIRSTSMLFACTLALAALCLFAVPVAVARPLCPVCMPPDKVTVQGPGIAGTPEITDGAVLAALAVTTIPGLDSPTTPAQPVSGASYEITRFYNLGTMGWPSYWTDGFDHFRYFPGTPGRAGVILYEGPTPGDTAHMASALGLDALTGKWLAATPQQDAALQALVASATSAVSRQQASGAGPARATSPSATSRQVAWPLTAWLVVLGGVSLALLGGTLGWRMRRRWVRAPAAISAGAAEHALAGDAEAEAELERSPVLLR
jgi:hypothetical protein